MQEPERQTERVSVYITQSMRERLTRAIAASEFGQSDWLRRALEAAIVQFETGGVGAEEEAEIQRDAVTPPEIALATAEAQIKGLHEINSLLRERLGMSDALNIELSKRLENSQTALERVTLMLPEAGESSRPSGFNWRFWQR